MNILALPVANGVLPRPGGSIQGLFLDKFSLRTLSCLGVEATAFLVPITQDGKALYPAGMLVRIEDLSRAEAVNPVTWNSNEVLVANLSGIVHATARRFVGERGFIVAESMQELDLKALRGRGEPVISGAGWQPQGGYTEPRSEKDITITIYGTDYDNNKVEIKGQVGGIVSAEKAHTLEHSIIRSLREYGLCTPKNLAWAMQVEAEELKDSISWGLHFKLPEILGQTRSGYCGNPMTSLAHFYLGQELSHFLQEGKTLPAALERARSRTLSRLTQDLDLGTEPAYLTLRGLKIGMWHDDSALVLSTLRRVLGTFPIDPWS
ncbi:MAG TPA: hypothetical protein GXX69_08020 [Firmicutes bacterium]|jgi:hypothetical protein|nr:hypothetical protein [Bacillota bacterium]